MHLVHPPKFCLTIAPKINWKQWLCKILGINKEYYGLCKNDEYKAFVVPCRHYGMLSLFPGVSFIGRGNCLFSLKCLLQTACNTEIRHCSDIFFCHGKKLGRNFFSEIWGSQQYLILFVDFLWIPGRAMNSKRGTLQRSVSQTQGQLQREES